MPQANNNTLAQLLPIEARHEVIRILHSYQVQLWIKRERFSKLGDFKPQMRGNPARISINGNLNVYSFLLVFLHEAAHAISYKQFGNTVAPHGKAWKEIFGFLLRDFVNKGCFHHTLIDAINGYSFRVKASGIGCPELQRLLRMFDNGHSSEGKEFLEDIPENSLFMTRTGQKFRKGQKLRTRYRCFSLDKKKIYLFNPLALVKKMEPGDSKDSLINVLRAEAEAIPAVAEYIF